MPEQEDNNLNTIPITPKASAWNKWKVLAIVNSIVIVGLATAMIIFIQNFKKCCV